MRKGRAGSTPLSVPVFRRVWVGTTVSYAGDSAGWIALVALSLGSAHANLPLLVALYTAPSPWAGWAQDGRSTGSTVVA